MHLPLAGIRVLDFSTLLPGPLASLILAEAGAEILKIERPDRGDEMRSYEPKFGRDSVNFALLNRGKRSLAIDLKDPASMEKLRGLVADADIVLEQFRPDVMERLGLGYEILSTINEKIIYCSITGYGQHGPLSRVAAHDLNYLAQSGMLGLSSDADGAPVLPPALIADIAGGTYPAIVNILLALRSRDQTGRGCKLDIAMADNLFTFLYWAIGNGQLGKWPEAGGELVTGGSPRYQVYRTKDDRFVAAAPLEEKFWLNFLQAIDAPAELYDIEMPPAECKRRVAQLIALRTAQHWERQFAGKDVCCAIVSTLEEAMNNPHFRSRGVFDRRVCADTAAIAALPIPLSAAFRGGSTEANYPSLGEANAEFGFPVKQ